MIDVALAEKFVKRSANYTQYSINVMDQNGVIIASSDENRVGSFHEIAYQILQADTEVVEVTGSDQFQGGRTGINMALFLHRTKVGVLGITGEPEKLREVSRLLRMSLETMLEYEEQKRKVYEQQSLQTRFIDALIYQDGTDHREELNATARQLGYLPEIPRFPILISVSGQTEARAVLDQIQARQLLRTQDICAVTRENAVILFRDYRNEPFSSYRYVIQEAVRPIESILSDIHADYRLYIGTLQDRLRHYRAGFQHCRWMQKHTEGSSRIYYFYDCIGEYMRSIAQVYELNRIFAPICGELQDERRDSTTEMIQALNHHNFNLNDSSRELFIHKNTLIFRFNKIREMFDINPMQNASDREFLNWMMQYLKMNR